MRDTYSLDRKGPMSNATEPVDRWTVIPRRTNRGNRLMVALSAIGLTAGLLALPTSAQAGETRFWAGTVSQNIAKSSANMSTIGGMSTVGVNPATVYSQTARSGTLEPLYSASAYGNGPVAQVSHPRTSGFNRCFWTIPYSAGAFYMMCKIHW